MIAMRQDLSIAVTVNRHTSPSSQRRNRYAVAMDMVERIEVPNIGICSKPNRRECRKYESNTYHSHCGGYIAERIACAHHDFYGHP